MLGKRKFVSVVILLILISAAPPEASAFTATISGIVKDSYTGKGVGGATVGLWPPSRGGLLLILPLKLTTTSITGAFSMTVDGLEWDTVYSLTATKNGYTGNTVTFTIPVSKVVIVPSKTIIITPLNIAPVAQANGPYSGNVGAVISFSSSGSSDPDGSIASYGWSFGDGSSSTNANPTHAYTVQGIYTVTLTVTDNGGLTGTDTATCTVVSPQAPIAAANGPYAAEVNSAVTFSSSGSSDPDGTIAEYRWDFGDGSPYSYEQNPTHVYTVAANFTASLRVTDNNGLTHTSAAQVVITPLPIDPVAEANGPYQGETSQEIVFDSTGSNDPDGSIVEYRWGFGDDTPNVYDWNATHIYSTPGTYTVTLTVTDNSGATDSDTATCTITLPPNVNPVAVATGPAQGEAEEPISFSSSSSSDADGEIVEYTWNFGDGSPVSHDPNPSHTYTGDGTFTVTLTVTDDRGGTHATTLTVAVAPKPGLPLLPIIGVVVIVGAAAAYYFLVMKKKQEAGPTPASLKVSAESTSLSADGRSTLQVNVTVLDEAGAPIAVAKDTVVSLSTSLGTVKTPVTIAKGGTGGSSTLTAGFQLGTANVSAEAEGLRPGRVSLSLVEKKRYCMHCGAQMSIHDNQCPKCGRMPPSGVDVKECKNCGEVIPIVARFCGECGARQPDVESEK